MSTTHTIGGMVLGLALGAGGLFAAQTYLLGPSEDCAGLCGEGTACEQGQCLLVEVEDEPVVEDVVEGSSKRKRGRRRKGRGSRNQAEGGDLDEGPRVDDDSAVPGFDANADQNVSMSDGTGRLSDGQVNSELGKLDKQFQACIRDAAGRVDDLGKGSVRYSFGIDGKGKVTGVNVTAPSKFSEAGVIPCVRNTIFGHRFPAFNGPTMRVKSSFDVD